MTLKEFKVWGGKREENDSLYIWAKDADDAIGIARLTDQSICISQWTGNEKSYEEAIKLVKEVAEEKRCEKCGEEHRQLAQWLKELKQLRKKEKTGHWIDHSDEGYVECSECGSATNGDSNIADLHFCFSCGAEMESEERKTQKGISCSN